LEVFVIAALDELGKHVPSEVPVKLPKLLSKSFSMIEQNMIYLQHRSSEFKAGTRNIRGGNLGPQALS
jgi:hypothetical protein